MSKKNPIKRYMTKMPHTIGEDMSLSKAMEKMREYGIRHLPVLYAGKLTGVLSDRDVKLALTAHPSAVDLSVGDIMSENPYTVSAECPLEEVVAEMGESKFGCAVVKDNEGRAIGVFTAVDALSLFGEWLRKKTVEEPKIRLIS